MAYALALTGGFFVVFGWLSDRIGRKPVMMTGCLLAVFTFFPIFEQMTERANPALAHAQATVPVTVTADPADCGSLFNPVGTRVYTSSCDIARAALTKSSVRYTTLAGPAAQPATIKIGETEIAAFDAKSVPDAKAAQAAFAKTVGAGLAAAGYPTGADPGIVKMAGPFDILRPQVLAIIGLLFALNLIATMVYGPIAATLVELFPTRIRYSGMSLPYHLGNGWFGGLLPATAFTDRRLDGKHLRRALVPGRHCRCLLRDRAHLPARNLQARHPRYLIVDDPFWRWAMAHDVNRI